MKDSKAFTHTVSREMLERGLSLSSTEKIRWLCRAKRFTYRHVSPEKLALWQELKRRDTLTDDFMDERKQPQPQKREDFKNVLLRAAKGG